MYDPNHGDAYSPWGCLNAANEEAPSCLCGNDVDAHGDKCAVCAAVEKAETITRNAVMRIAEEALTSPRPEDWKKALQTILDSGRLAEVLS